MTNFCRGDNSILQRDQTLVAKGVACETKSPASCNSIFAEHRCITWHETDLPQKKIFFLPIFFITCTCTELFVSANFILLLTLLCVNSSNVHD